MNQPSRISSSRNWVTFNCSFSTMWLIPKYMWHYVTTSVAQGGDGGQLHWFSNCVPLNTKTWNVPDNNNDKISRFAHYFMLFISVPDIHSHSEGHCACLSCDWIGMHCIVEVRQQQLVVLFLHSLLKHPWEARRSWMTRGSRWHVFYPSGSQEAGWADQWDRLPVSRLLWLLWTVPQRRGLDFLGNFCFSYTVNILPPLPALSCCLQLITAGWSWRAQTMTTSMQVWSSWRKPREVTYCLRQVQSFFIPVKWIMHAD